MPSQTGKNLQGKVENFLTNQIANLVAKGLRRYINNLVNIFLKALVGGFLAVIGIIFIWIGLVDFLSIYFSRWQSWIIIGIISLVIAAILIQAAKSKK